MKNLLHFTTSLYFTFLVLVELAGCGTVGVSQQPTNPAEGVVPSLFNNKIYEVIPICNICVALNNQQQQRQLFMPPELPTPASTRDKSQPARAPAAADRAHLKTVSNFQPTIPYHRNSIRHYGNIINHYHSIIIIKG